MFAALSLDASPPSKTLPGSAKRLKLARLKTRADFLRAQKGVRKSRTGLGLEICTTPDKALRAGTARNGFTATKKIGNAVIRNRAKRRLRAAAAAVLPLYAQEGRDYVLVARPATLTLPFGVLKDELASALHAVHAAKPATPRT